MINLLGDRPDSDTAALLLHHKEDVLGMLLKLLASEDRLDSRGCYAKLIGLLSLHADQAQVKHIGDAGAVPYVLSLLKQAQTDSVKASCVQCLQVRPYLQQLSADMLLNGWLLD